MTIMCCSNFESKAKIETFYVSSYPINLMKMALPNILKEIQWLSIFGIRSSTVFALGQRQPNITSNQGFLMY